MGDKTPLPSSGATPRAPINPTNFSYIRSTLKKTRNRVDSLEMLESGAKISEESILVVDDTTTNRFVLRSVLQHAGYHVSEADSGEKCLTICDQSPPSIVLLDCVMPGIDGIETCRILREKFGRASLPILMVTSLAESENLALAISAGASDYVTKPIDKTVLLARVANQLALQRSHRELERALEVQRTIGEMLPQALLAQRSDGAILFANSKVPEELHKLPIDQVFQQLHGGLAADAYKKCLVRLRREPLADIDFEAEAGTGTIRNLDVTSRAVSLAGGETLRLWLWRDLTATRELERKVNERVRLDMVSLFVGGVAHNFNNILMTIAGAAEMLTRSVPPDERSHRLIKMIIEGARAATQFSRKMNVFSRPDLDGSMAKGEFVADIVQAIVLPLEIEFGERVNFVVEVGVDIPETSMSLSHMGEIFSNLLRNAAESIVDHGTVTISISHTPGSDHLVIIIADNGVGMSAEVLGRVFEPFFSTKNLDERNSVSMRGNGLGLWNVYNLVKIAGGDITVESTPGRGTVVTTLLPTKQP